MIKQAAADHPGRGASLQLRVLGPDDGSAGLPGAALAPPPAPVLGAAGGAGGRLLVHPRVRALAAGARQDGRGRAHHPQHRRGQREAAAGILQTRAARAARQEE